MITVLNEDVTFDGFGGDNIVEVINFEGSREKSGGGGGGGGCSVPTF